ncbi:esterase [Fusobacterium perfoetens]|uniref:alpha/beta hydrolase n=1 Tax=Fusobacterium perfoetens TaxID=852 RepID=UPI00159FDDA6|nr:alpha/beta hydrolase-fold protein [Fusobacterium perfoetens]MCF2625453.1 esterase [Fusobacterium perfoetens]
MALNILIILAVFSLLFYIVTYPYDFKLERKLKRVKSFSEVSYVSKEDKCFKKYDFDKIDEYLNIEEKFLDSVHVDEKMRYILVTPKGKIKEDTPCLFLLHGIRDYPEDWINRACLLENYLTLREINLIDDIIFILPASGYNGESWYTNFFKDPKHKYEDYFTGELYEEARKISPKGKIGIAGFSMGGYGAFKLGFMHPEKYSVVGSFSGAVSLIRMSVNRRVMRIMRYVYIPKFLFNDVDKSLFIRIFSSWGWRILKQDPYSIIKVIDPKRLKGKKFYISVGAEDKKPYLMLQQWIDIVGRLKKYQVDFKGYIYKDEVHTWEYISKDLPNFICYFNREIKR